MHYKRCVYSYSIVSSSDIYPLILGASNLVDASRRKRQREWSVWECRNSWTPPVTARSDRTEPGDFIQFCSTHQLRKCYINIQTNYILSLWSVTCPIQWRCQPRRRGEGSCNFPTDIYKCPTEKIMGAQNFNFAPKFPQNEGFQPNVCIFGRTFSDKKKIFRQLLSDSPKFRRGPCPPPCHDATWCCMHFYLLFSSKSGQHLLCRLCIVGPCLLGLPLLCRVHIAVCVYSVDCSAICQRHVASSETCNYP